MKKLRILKGGLLLLLAGLLLIGCVPGGDEPAVPTVVVNTPVAVVETPTVASGDVVETVVPVETAVPQETVESVETAVPPTHSPTTAPAQPVVIVPTDMERVMALANLNVRMGPGLGFTVVDWLTEGETAVVTGISEDGG